jgi:sulfotransferase family protein
MTAPRSPAAVCSLPCGPAERRQAPDAIHAGALPNLVVIGAMKCGTTALHRYLDQHPQIAMSEPKELNFFFGPAKRPGDGTLWKTHDDGAWTHGNWHRSLAWYARHFPAQTPVRGESSPGYTSPSYPGVAERMAALIPTARLLYLVRDPVERAVSQYRHHRAEGTETRPLQQALLDPGSQYVARGRYSDRLAPFLAHFEQKQILIVSQEELLSERRTTLQAIFRFVGVDEGFWSSDLQRPWHATQGGLPQPDRRLRQRLAGQFRDDADRLRQLAAREFPGWSV